MLRRKTLDATILYQARERSFHGPVSIRSLGVAVDSPPCRECLGRGKMNVTGVADLTVHVARPVVANEAQRLRAAPRECQATRKVQMVIQVLPLINPVDRPVSVTALKFRGLCRPGFSSQRAPGFLTCLEADRSWSSASFESNRSVIGHWSAIAAAVSPGGPGESGRHAGQARPRRSCFVRPWRRTPGSWANPHVPKFQTHLRSAIATGHVYGKRRTSRTQSPGSIPSRATADSLVT